MKQSKERRSVRLGYVLRDFLYSSFWFIYLLLRKNKYFEEDLLVWVKNCSFSQSGFFSFLRLVSSNSAFRSLIYFRLKNQSIIAWFVGSIYSIFYKGMNNLYIWCNSIDGGFFIQHGFSTIIIAENIGSFFWVNQQVTIGWTEENGSPTIGNNVKVGAGAKILGKIKIGNNVRIGANAVVLKDVPDNCTIVGVPAKIVRLNGEKCNIELR
jgi:serine O-acetyltransferase